MKIKVKLFAFFMKYLPEEREGDSFTLEIDSPACVNDVLQKLEIPARYPRLIQINGVMANESTLLKEGDKLTVFPPLPGG